MIRIGIVGCGRILAAHLEGYRLLREAGVDNFEVTALCSRKAEDAQAYVKRGEGPPQRRPVSELPGDPLAVGDEYLSDFQPGTDVAIFTDYREMIEQGPVDAVNDFTTHRMHHQVAEVSFENEKHLLSQKPLAITMEAARRMCAQAEYAGVTFGVFENLRFAKGVRHQQWAFGENGVAGEFQMAAMGSMGVWWAPDLIVAETPWRHEKAEGGGMALDLAPHFFDMVRSVGGSEIREVSARTQVVEAERYLQRGGEKVDPVRCDADDTFHAHFACESGATGTMFGSWAGRGAGTTVEEGAVFYGSRARVAGDRIDFEDGRTDSLARLYEAEAPDEVKERHFPLGLENDFALAQLDWLRAIERNGDPETSGTEGLVDLACAYAIVESATAGRAVTVEEVLNGGIRAYQAPIDAAFGLP